MTFAGLALAYLRRRAGQALLSMTVGALGIAAIATVLVAFDALPRAARQAWGGADLVVGPKGSALDLVLCCALHVAEPRGLVSLEAATNALRGPMIRAGAPIALGDNVGGWRVVGTVPALLDIYRARFAAGAIWTDKLQAVAGATAARQLGLKLGDSLVSAHGLADSDDKHDRFPYKLVGILEPTGSVIDRLVLTDIETVHHVHQEPEGTDGAKRGATGQNEAHEHEHDEVTAVVVAFRAPTAALRVQRQIDGQPALTAASPSVEIARLMGYARPLIAVATGLGLLLVSIAAVATALGLLATMNVRVRDLALLRALGASRIGLATVALCEAAIISGGALVIGLVVAAGLLALIRDFLLVRTGLSLELQPDPGLIGLLVGGAILAALLAAAVPSLRAMRADIEELLQS